MAHLINLDVYRNRANMAYVNQTPWHGVGQRLTENAPIEVWAEEAGFTHDIVTRAVQYQDFDGRMITHPNRNVLFHSKTKAALGIVSNRYHVVQPKEVLEFYRDLVEASGEFALETAGVLDAGQRYWALAKHKGSISFGSDHITPYLLLATSCDGTMATRAQFTSVRVVCQNTLQASISEKSPNAISIPHSRKFVASDIKKQLNIHARIDSMTETFESLVNKRVDDETAIDIFVNLLAKRDLKGNLTNQDQVKRISRELWSSLKKSPGSDLESAQGTGWGVMNAVTHYVDHKARSQSTSSRFKSGQLGNGADLKSKAFSLIQAA
jgi:phage/plasmid-like protein (TIGR03299 family)